jgi:transcriptional regulator GlxA family with amidase domain
MSDNDTTTLMNLKDAAMEGHMKASGMEAVFVALVEGCEDEYRAAIYWTAAKAFRELAELLENTEETLRHMPSAARSLEVSA